MITFVDSINQISHQPVNRTDMIRIEDNVALRPLNTFGLQGTVRRLVTYTDPSDLTELFADPGTWKTGKVTHIGAGSNLLFVGDYDGTILKSAIESRPVTTAESAETISMTAGAGMLMDDLCTEIARQGLWGTENLSGIPGQVGAAAVQNIGAYGVEISDLIEEVHLFDTEATTHITMKGSQCGYGYRTSIFKRSPLHGRYIVTAVTLRLSKLPAPRLSYGHLAVRVSAFPSPDEIRREVIAMRDSKLPDWHRYGNAGSYFKNVETDLSVYERICSMVEPDEVPHYRLDDGRVKIPTAWLIERCDWKGECEGDAMVWQKQPLVLVNATGNATAADIIRLEEKIISSVHTRFGVTIEPEVEKIKDI